jgi:hypothetical protein
MVEDIDGTCSTRRGDDTCIGLHYFSPEILGKGPVGRRVANAKIVPQRNGV